MNTPFSTVSPTPALTDNATLEAALDCLLETMPIDMQGNHAPQTLYEVLLWAASHHDTVNHACEMLNGVPTANDIRYHLSKFDNIQTLEAQLNQALQSRLPEDIINHLGLPGKRRTPIFTFEKHKFSESEDNDK